MKNSSILFAFLVICLVNYSQVSAKKFTKCALAKELVKNGIAKKDLPNWLCLVQSESNYNTAAVGRPNSDKSRDWGLFQINDRYWCKDGRAGGDCKINCRCGWSNSMSDLLN